MNLSFKNRLAFYYMLATAIIIALVFAIVFIIVKRSVYKNLDYVLSFEARKHTGEIGIKNEVIYFVSKAEWEEIEHREVSVNPVFIQLMDDQGKLMDKSPNLKGLQLPFSNSKSTVHNFNTKLGDLDIRQVQIPIVHDNIIKGYIIGAVSLKDAKMVISNLGKTLLILFPAVLLILFGLSRYLAGRSIQPIKNITDTTNRITKNTLAERVALPPNKDELYKLSASINNLLSRIENALDREKQFTSDASHQLRTPLSAVQGTLEVLIRKPRTQKEYEEKISYSLSEIANMTETLEQLLILSRFDPDQTLQNEVAESVITVVESILKQYHQLIKNKNLKVQLEIKNADDRMIPSYCAHLILDNIIHNSIKYTLKNGMLKLGIYGQDQQLVCVVEDNGIGIKNEDLDHIFLPFFRSAALSHKDIQGNGLGLSIAKKAADAIGAKIKVISEPGTGSTFTVSFLSKS